MLWSHIGALPSPLCDHPFISPLRLCFTSVSTNSLIGPQLLSSSSVFLRYHQSVPHFCSCVWFQSFLIGSPISPQLKTFGFYDSLATLAKFVLCLTFLCISLATDTSSSLETLRLLRSYLSLQAYKSRCFQNYLTQLSMLSRYRAFAPAYFSLRIHDLLFRVPLWFPAGCEKLTDRGYTRVPVEYPVG